MQRIGDGASAWKEVVPGAHKWLVCCSDRSVQASLFSEEKVDIRWSSRSVVSQVGARLPQGGK